MECLLALAVLSLVLPPVMTFLFSFQQQTAVGLDEMEMEGNLRTAVNRVALLVQQAGHNPQHIAMTPIQILSAGRLYLECDVNDGSNGPADGMLGGTYEQVFIEWDEETKQVYQRSGKGSRQPLAADITFFEVKGINGMGEVAASNEDIIWIDIHLKSNRSIQSWVKPVRREIDWSVRIPIFSRL